MDTITMDGNTTLYVLLLSYENAIKDMSSNAGDIPPEPTAAPTPVPAEVEPAVTPAPELVITKGPTSETVNVGGQAIFVAKANNATAITWMFAGSDNTIVLAKDAPNYFGCAVYGLGTDTITVANIPNSMNGWQIQCKFDGNGGPKWTSLSTLTVDSAARVPVPAPAYVPTSGSDLAAEAEALAWDNLYSIASRTQDYGWNMGTMGNFYYDSSVQTAQYDITATYNGMSINVACRSYPLQSRYQPGRIQVYLNGSEIFSDSYDGANESQAWAAFINDVAAIAGRNTPAPASSTVTYGEFIGTTGTILKLVVKWSASDNGNGTTNLILDAYVEASTLHSSSISNGLGFQIGNDIWYATTNSIEDNSTNLVQTYLGSYSGVVTSGNMPVVVSWTFNGVYSGQNIVTVQASAVLPLGT